MAPRNALNQSCIESLRQGQSLAQPSPQFMSSPLRLDRIFSSQFIYSFTSWTTRQALYQFSAFCHVVIRASSSSFTQSQVITKKKKRFPRGRFKNHSGKSHIDLSLSITSNPLPNNLLQTRSTNHSTQCKLFAWVLARELPIDIITRKTAD